MGATNTHVAQAKATNGGEGERSPKEAERDQQEPKDLKEPKEPETKASEVLT